MTAMMWKADIDTTAAHLESPTMLSVFSTAVSALATTASSPPVVCQIAMSAWCIVEVPSTIQMHDAGDTRTWEISTNADTAEARVLITEDKFCDGELFYKSSAGQQTVRLENRDGSCGLTVSVVGQAHGVNVESIVRMLVMLKRKGRWVAIPG